MNKTWLSTNFIMMVDILFKILTKSGEIGVAFLLQYVMDVVSGDYDFDFAELCIKVLLYLLCLFCVACVSKRIDSLYVNTTITEVKENLFAGIINSDEIRFRKHGFGYYMSLFNTDLEIIKKDIYQNRINIIIHIYTIVATLAAMIYISPLIAVVSILFAIVPLCLPLAFVNKKRELLKVFSETNSQCNSQLKDYLEGIDVIRAYGVHTNFIHNHDKKNKMFLKSVLAKEFYDNITDSLIASMSLIMQFAVYISAGIIAMSGKTSMGAMIGALQLCAYIVQPVKEIAQYRNSFIAAKEVQKKILDFSRSETQEQYLNEKHPHSLNVDVVGVSYKYEREHRYALTDISLSLEQGKKYALIGENASGKTTFTKLLSGMLTNYEGEIKIGGISMHDLGMDTIRRYIAVISQKVFLFNDSIRNNITLYKEYDESEIEAVIKKAGLSQMISKLPCGIETMVSENGNNFSGGEAQRIAAARAILWDTPIIICDEANSSLDNKNSKFLEELIMKQKEKTIVNITHQTSSESLRGYDGIILLRAGRLEAFDTYDNLIVSNAYFKGLVC